MLVLFLLLGFASSVIRPDVTFWLQPNVGTALGAQKELLRAENVASYGGLYKYTNELNGNKYEIGDVWDAFEALHCKGALANSRFFVVARVCYDENKFTKREVADGEIFVRYGAFSQMHDGRFEKIEQIRIQYFHVVLKAAGEFILTEYSKPAAMMTWDEQTEHVWDKKDGDSEPQRCVIVGPGMYESEKKKEMNVIRWAFRNTERYMMRMYNDFKGRNEVYWQTDLNNNPIFPQQTDEGAPAYCFISGSWPIEWKLFGFVSDRRQTKEINNERTNNIGVIESIYREFMQIKEEKPEFFEYAKPIWEQINENMIQRGELRQP